MISAIADIVARLRQLIRQREGNIAILFGICAIPVVIAAGIAIDAARAYTVKVRLGAALDAAALAVGSEVNENPAQLATLLQNYFTANYPAMALGDNVMVAPVPGNASLTAAVVNYQAQATVPMTFMQLVGINSITVTANAQTKRTAGIEVALVLDNTGSMLCVPVAGAPNYSNALCQQNVVAGDTSCTNAGNQSRICTLRNAAVQFVNTLTSAITASGQLYIGVVPYVTTVNVGNAFCTGATACNHIAADCAGHWTDQYGSPVVMAGNVAAWTGTTTGASKIVTNIAPGTTGLVDGMWVSGTGIPAGATIASVDSATQIHISVNAGSSNANKPLQFGVTGTTTAGSNTVTSIAPASALTISSVLTNAPAPATAVFPANPVGGVVGSGVATVDSPTQVHLCNTANTTKAGAQLMLAQPIAYDTTHTATTNQWMGCVIEPTSTDENKGVEQVINAGTVDPDFTEPGAWPNWYPFWWTSNTPNGINNWSGGVVARTTAADVQGQVTTDWDTFPGPNQGCPVPLLTLTDGTTAAGKTTVLNTINSMWPRDAGGTQVHIGMIWGWRTLSPNGPFAPNNAHPLDYATQGNEGWKKVIVLMTDGTEEWPASRQLTGLGNLADGKIGTTSTTSCIENGGNDCSAAAANLGTRLANVCNNIAANGNYIVYTIVLGSDGASNVELQNCPTGGGFFEAATTGNLNQVFDDIAKSLIALRLTQ